MNKQRIKELALANGFKLKEQPGGVLDLNPYVYEFAAAMEEELQAQVERLRKENIEQSLVAIKARWQVEAVGELGNWLCTDLERDLAELQIIHGIVSTDYMEKLDSIKAVSTKIHWYIDNVLRGTGANK